MPDQKFSLWSMGGPLLAVVAGATALAAGIGTRWEIWNYRVGLAMLKWAAYGGLAGAVLSLVGLFSSVRIAGKKGLLRTLFGMAVGFALVAVSLEWMETAKAVPRIHDITTDTAHPPEFVAILPHRKNATNPAEYGGPQIAALQIRAYPDIVPLFLNIPPDAAFEKAVALARKKGWEIIDANKEEGRIEAVATTFWFGFKDDVVIRIKRADSGSRVDMRSESRVGVSDLGTNAKRIRDFLGEMRE